MAVEWRNRGIKCSYVLAVGVSDGGIRSWTRQAVAHQRGGVRWSPCRGGMCVAVSVDLCATSRHTCAQACAETCIEMCEQESVVKSMGRDLF